MIQNGQATIEQTLDGWSITIPTKKNWFALLFCTVWMGGWYFGFKTASGAVFSSEAGGNGFITFWLLGWTVGGIFVTVFLLWGYFGKERFVMDRNTVRFERTILGIGIKNEMDRAEIKNFRTDLAAANREAGNNRSFPGIGPGKIKFDYGLKTYSFGHGLDDAEATYIVGLLQEAVQKS